MEEKNLKPDDDRDNFDEEKEPERSTDRDEAIPEFGRLDDEDRTSER